MSRIDLSVVGERQQLLVNAAVKGRSKLLRSIGWREIRAAHVAHEERVSREDDGGPFRQAAIPHQDADAFDGVPGGLQELQTTLTEANFVSVLHRDVRELSPGVYPEIDLRSSPFSEFAMA